MKKKIYWLIGSLSLFAVIAINISLAKANVASNLSMAQIKEAIGGGFEFNGQNWDTEYHWYNVAGGDWKPEKINCTGYDYDSQNRIIASWPGQKIQCQNGNGNCYNGTSCVGNSAQ
jgi:hypothetical protein